MIDDSAALTIGTGVASDDVAPYLRLSSPHPQLVRGEAASNAFLGPDFQLDAGQLAGMERLGWQPKVALAEGLGKTIAYFSALDARAKYGVATGSA